ncbi:hypothetical protein LY76DRAFT_679889 [Colletotrichum caudatum]|nr:hypothetical protein LY76DRAFT_679889 [Colletotrichum caudatum]
MKFITALLALAATAVATEDHDHGKEKTKSIVTEVLATYTTVCPVTVTKPGHGATHYETVTTTSTVVEKVSTTVYETLPGHTDYVTKTDIDYATYASLCPVTETVTGDGHTYTKTYTKISTIVEKEIEYTTITELVPHTKTLTQDGHNITKTYTETHDVVKKLPTKVLETVKLPDVTKTEKDVEYTTLTSLCPITETKTVGGETVVVTWISTSTIVTQVPTKTVTKPVTTYQTIEHGETHWVIATETKTVTVEKVHTITEVLVETKMKHVEVTRAVIVGDEDVVTQKSWVYVTVSGAVYATQTRAPGTVVVPTTSAVTVPAITFAPAAAVLAGIFGSVALL